MRTRHLIELLQLNTSTVSPQAQTFFEGLKVNGVANKYQWSVMQQMCDTSEQRRSMMDEMAEAGVQLDVALYTNMVKQLIFEGKFEDARAVVDTEMPSAGLVPSDHTHALFEKSEETWSRMRTTHMQDLLDTSATETRQHAQAFFEGLKLSGATNVFQWSLMQQHCDTSAEQWSMIEEMVEAGVQPDAVTYSLLVRKMLIEGKCGEAQAVMEIEMPSVGIVPDETTRNVQEA